ncbi:unnamed protein product [Lymnaea stagnalis]|uniref:tRNA wybutosine-synthesizing protein 4 n=1 Tax=Lymnaea stagnalis TaxID=6523 RepID=A0AAV2GYE6_LYMST
MEDISSLAKKTNKSRRETAVQGTNDSSIVSKCSTSSCGYFNDPFLHYFVSKVSRRAPLIHRGYYIRAVAFDRIIKNFLELYGDAKKQIISLGCGFDSSYFRLKSAQLLNKAVFCEIDFPELVKRKRLLIENTDDLMSLIEKVEKPPLSPHIELSCTDYHLLGVDLTQLNTLEAALKMCGINFDVPTLLLSECVMTYMTRRCSTELVKWASETFEEAIFGMYEQMNPDDAFGLFMQNHFHSIGSPLKCINAFPTLESQIRRFLNTGWSWCEAFDMNTFYYKFVETQEKRRIEKLETFDEYEELNLKYSHYFILTASTVDLKRSLIRDRENKINVSFSDSTFQPAITNVLAFRRMPEDDQSVRRFGHASSIINERCTVTTGGFGEIDGRHQRLAEITITDLGTFKSYHVPCYSTHVQYSRMHHASISLSNGTTYLVGGRQSPYFMCNQMLKLTLNINLEKLQHSTSKEHVDAQDVVIDPAAVASKESVMFAQQDGVQRRNGKTGGRRTKKCHRSDSEHSEDNQTQSYLNSEQYQAKVQYTATPRGDCQWDAYEHSRINCDTSDKLDYEHSIIENERLSTLTWTFELGSIEVNIVSQKGSVPIERWRHAAAAVFVDGKEKLFVHGGKTKSCDVLEDCLLFDPDTEAWEELKCSGELPGPRHSHCVSYWNGHIVLSGGVNAYHEPVGDICLLDLSRNQWEKMDVTGNLYSRYSHTAHIHEDKLILVGGVNVHHPPPGVAVINLRTRKALEFALPNQDKRSLLMFHRHTSIMLASGDVVILGGGGNCFSFGTHLNRTPVLLNVVPCVEAVQ